MSEILLAALRKHFGNKQPEHLSQPATGKFNQTWFFSLEGRQLVFRLAPLSDTGFLFYEKNMMAQEPALHTLVRARTNLPVPEILVYDQVCDVAPSPFLIMTRLPGEPLTSQPVDLDKVFRQVGEYLGELHRSLVGEAYGYVGAHQPMASAPSWAEAFETMWNKLLDDIVACGGYEPGKAKFLRRLFQRDKAVFQRHVPACLLHMDIWHQNILVDTAGRVSGILDWDRALYGDPEIEFAVLDYCGVSTPAFWQGYGAERDDSAEASLRGVYYYLYELQKYIVIRTLRCKDPGSAQNFARSALKIAKKIA